uniref:Ion transport domain-containing protein n=1 Tax=Strigamia maritima TaxID=126957 RepID=T1JKK7_STRMM
MTSLTLNRYFDYVMILTILFNCVFLALSTPVEEADVKCKVLRIYTTEMLIKAIAKGFILNKYTYLRNPWNWLDFIVIILGFVTSFVSVRNISGLKTFRVFRALKTVSILPGLKTIVNALLHSIKMLSEVMLLTVFCLMVFALFALQIYMGTLLTKCVADNNATMTPEEYFNYIQDRNNWLTENIPDKLTYINCGNESGQYQCDANYTCLPDIGDNPNFGYTSFDNFGSSMLNTFQLITLDYWEDIYNRVIFANGPIHLIYFVLVVFFGSFYLVNLMLAVVAMAYETEVEATQRFTSVILNPQCISYNPALQYKVEIQLDKEYAEELKEAMHENQPKPKKVKKRRIITRHGAITLTDPISDTELDPAELTRTTGTKTSAFPAQPPPAIPSLQDDRPKTTLDGGPSDRWKNQRPNTEIDIPNVPYSRYSTATAVRNTGSIRSDNNFNNNASFKKLVNSKVVPKNTTCDCGLENRENSLHDNTAMVENGEIINTVLPPTLFPEHIPNRSLLATAGRALLLTSQSVFPMLNELKNYLDVLNNDPMDQ